MHRKRRVITALCAAAGNLFYIAGIYELAVAGGRVSHQMTALAFLAVALGPLLFFAESRTLALSRPRVWAMLAVLGPVGWVLLLLLRRPRSGSREPSGVVTAGDTAPADGGRAPLLIMAACWLTAIVALADSFVPGPADPARRRVAGEKAALANMRRIVQAQQRYFETDWDHDGRAAYARFLPHLWTTVDERVRPVRTGLLHRRLAFAINPQSAFEGYYFLNVVTPDSQSGFRILGLPAFYGESGRLAFRTDGASGVFAADLKDQVLPADLLVGPTATDWVEIRDDSDLRNLQRQLH